VLSIANAAAVIAAFLLPLELWQMAMAVVYLSVSGLWLIFLRPGPQGSRREVLVAEV